MERNKMNVAGFGIRLYVSITCLTCAMTVAHGKTFKILAAVDHPYTDSIRTNLEAGLEYLHEEYGREGGFLEGHTVELEVMGTMDNDSFGAMEGVCAQLEGGISLIIDLSSRYVTLTLRSLAEALGITHVASVDPSYYERDTKEYNVSVNIVPPSSVMLQSIRSIVSQENLTNVGIIYDHTFDLDNKPKRLLRNIPAQHLYLRMVTEENEIGDQLDKIKSAELTHLFLACNKTNAKNYLEKANEKKMMSFKFNWYVLTKDAQINCDGCTEKGKVVLLTTNTNHQVRDAYVDMMYERSLARGFTSDDIEISGAFQFDLIHMLSFGLKGMAATWKTINYTDCFSFTETDPEAYTQAVQLKEQIKNTSTVFVAGPLVWEHDEAILQMDITIKRLEFENGEKINEYSIGNWTDKNGLMGSIVESDVKKVYRIVTLEEPPFVFKTRSLPVKEGVTFNYYKHPGNGFYYYGYCIDLIFEINQTMKFEFELLEPADEAYGTMQLDGSWNGMVAELMQDRADIAVSPLSVMAERENVIDFTVPYYDLVGITILMKKPPFGYSVFKFMSVLEDAVWGCVLSAFIIVSILLAVFDKYSPYSYQNNRTSWDGQGEEPRVFTLKEGLWFCMTSLTPQGGGEAPRALSGRLVAATWWVFGFIMIATYTANLAAFLTVSRLEQPIESLDDLAKQFKTKYSPQKSTSTETYFRRMADIESKFYTIWKDMSLNDSLDQIERAKLAVWDYPVSDKFTNMWASMENSGFPSNFTEAIRRIKAGGEDNEEEYAFIGDATQNKYATLTDCDLWEVGEEFSRKPYALAVQEGSPLKNELSSRILQLLNQRVLEDLKTKWWEFNRRSCPKIEDESDGISIYNIGGVFLVIFIGIGLGLITLAFEYYWYKWRPAASNKQNENGMNGRDMGEHTTSSGMSDNGRAITNGHDNSAFSSIK